MFVGKESKSFRKKNLSPSLAAAKAIRNVRFAHKASAGDTIIDLNNLNTPSAEMPTFVQATPSEVASLSLTINKKNLLLQSSAGNTGQDLDYVVTGAAEITLSRPALEGEIFIGHVLAVPLSDLIVAGGKMLRGTVEVDAAQTIVNIGTPFLVNQNPSDQIGDIEIFNMSTGQILTRNVGNAAASPSADGNYHELDTGSGTGTQIELNNALGVDSVLGWRIGFVAQGDLDTSSELERIATTVSKMAEDLALATGNSKTDYITATVNEIERQAFADRVQGLEESGSPGNPKLGTPDVAGATKKNRYQQKILPSNITSNNSNIGSVSFNNLVIGRTYRVTLQAALNSVGGDDISFFAEHDGTILCNAACENDVNTQNDGFVIGVVSAPFIATATTLEVGVEGIVSGSTLVNGDGTTEETFSVLEELNDYEATGDFT